MRGPGGKGWVITRKNSGGGGSVPATKQNTLAPVSKTAMQVRITAPSPSTRPWHTIHRLDGPPRRAESRVFQSEDPTSQCERRNSPPQDFPKCTTFRRTRHH